MHLTVNIERSHLTFFIVFVLVVMGIGLVVAAVPNPGHPMGQVEGLDANGNGIPDSAEQVDWSGIQSMPAGFADGVDNAGGGALSCQIVQASGRGWKSVTCPAGKTLTGGGCSCGDDRLLRTVPQGSTAWRCDCRTLSQSVTAYAICCNLA